MLCGITQVSTPNEVLEVQAVRCSQLAGESSACSVMKWHQPLPLSDEVAPAPAARDVPST